MILTVATIFATSFIIALSGALMPGPLLTATISESSRRGFLAGPILIIGHGVLELLLVIGLILGLAPFLNKDATFAFIAISGAGILVWMGVGMLRSSVSLSLTLETRPAKQGRLVFNGALLSLANPYWTVWWATIGLGYILHSMKFGVPGIAAFFTGHILADLAWYSLVSLAIAQGKRFISDRFYKGLITVCGTFLIGFAFYFLVAGVRQI